MVVSLKDKLHELQRTLRKKKLDCALFWSSSQDKQDLMITYFAGENVEFGFLVVPLKGKIQYIIPGFEYARLRTAVKSKLVKVVELNETKLQGALRHILGKHPKRIGINDSVLSVAEAIWLRKQLRATLVNVGKELRVLRRTKTKEEIQHLKKAAVITDKIVQSFFRKLPSLGTERRALDFLQAETAKYSCTYSFPPILASGKNAATPHYVPTTKKLQKGFLILDFGIKYRNYCSDITRTVYLGIPSKADRVLYQRVLEVQKKILAAIEKNVKYEKLDILCQKALGRYFIHALGHGIGLEVHESPSISYRSKGVVEEGDAIAIEPGYYIKNKLGIRIEDDVAIINGKAQVLTKTPKDLKIIKIR